MAKTQQNTAPAFAFKLTEVQLIALTIALAAGYAVYSFFSDGFYQHDEAAHFLNMHGFWYNPNSILGNWAKPGYKLIFAPVSLLGIHALVFVNSLVAALSCYMAYKLAETVGSKIPVLAVIMLALQPFWVQLSFRNYSEPITALILIAAVLAHYKHKEWMASLLLSYTAMIRQEMYILIGLYGLYLLYKRNWKAAFLLAVFPLVHNVWGWSAKGDPFFLLHEVMGFSQKIQDAYPRQGFSHYFKMSLTIFGGLTLTYFIAYLGQGLFSKKKWHWFILIPAALYFSAHVIFSIQSYKIGPSTGGNLRYLIVISPLLAVLAGIAAERMLDYTTWDERKKLLYLWVPFIVVVFAFLSYKHNNIVLTTDRDFIPVLIVLLSISLVFIKLSPKSFVISLLGIALVSVFLTIRPFHKSPEDEVVYNFVEWAKDRKLEDNHLLMNHTLIYYYYGKVEREFANGAEHIMQETVDDAPIGSIIVWDSHYSYRPKLRDGQLLYSYFLEKPDQFKQLVKPIITPDQRFGIFVFEKIKG